MKTLLDLNILYIHNYLCECPAQGESGYVESDCMTGSDDLKVYPIILFNFRLGDSNWVDNQI